MIYRLYCSSGNTVGVHEYVSYSEIGDDGFWTRYVEIRQDGTALRYSEAHPADKLGILPEGRWNDEEASKPDFGVVREISADLFEAVWSSVRAQS